MGSSAGCSSNDDVRGVSLQHRYFLLRYRSLLLHPLPHRAPHRQLTPRRPASSNRPAPHQHLLLLLLTRNSPASSSAFPSLQTREPASSGPSSPRHGPSPRPWRSCAPRRCARQRRFRRGWCWWCSTTFEEDLEGLECFVGSQGTIVSSWSHSACASLCRASLRRLSDLARRLSLQQQRRRRSKQRVHLELIHSHHNSVHSFFPPLFRSNFSAISRTLSISA